MGRWTSGNGKGKTARTDLPEVGVRPGEVDCTGVTVNRIT